MTPCLICHSRENGNPERYVDVNIYDLLSDHRACPATAGSDIDARRSAMVKRNACLEDIMEVICPKCGAKDEVDISDIPPGKAILRCENCGANFEITIRGVDIPQAKCDQLDAGLSVVCPYCKKQFITAPNIVIESEFWRCPSCGGIIRIVGDKAQEIEEAAKSQPAKLITEPQIASTELDELEAKLTAKNTPSKKNEPILIAPEIGIDNGMIPPLPEKERFTAQFTVKVAGAELGPISFNVLVDWARSGMIPRDALVAKVDDGRYNLAYSMPELRPLFDGTSVAEEPGKGIREILNAESAGVTIAYGATAGIIGGTIMGILAAIVVLLGLWSPMWRFPASLQSLIALGALAIAGTGIGAIDAALGEWVIDDPWTAAVQSVIGLLLAVGMFISAIIMSGSMKSATVSAIGVFVMAFGAGYIACQFHHKLFEKTNDF